MSGPWQAAWHTLHLQALHPPTSRASAQAQQPPVSARGCALCIVLALIPEHGQLIAQSCAVCSELPWSATYVYSIQHTCTARTHARSWHSWHRSSVCAVQSRDDADDDADDVGELAMSKACSSGPIGAVARLSVGFRRAPVERIPSPRYTVRVSALRCCCLSATPSTCAPCFDLPPRH